MNQVIEYIADEPTQTVHAFHANVPFCSFIILPEDFIQGTNLITSAFIEDIYAYKINARCVFKNITLLLTAELV